MKDIGKKLKEQRQSQNLSYADVAKMTKMPESHIRAIESGAIEYFQEDITYLRFYLRAYCKALHIPFEQYKEQFDDDMEEFTQTLSLKAVKEREEIEENIASRKEIKKADTYTEPPIATMKDRNSIRQNANMSNRFRKKGKLDISLISLLAIVAIVIAVVVFVMFNNRFNPSTNDTNKESSVTENNTTPTPEENNKKEEQETTPEEPTFTITEVAADNYLVEGLKLNDAFKLEVKLSGTISTWIQGTLNGDTVNSIISSDTYAAGTPIVYEGVVGQNDVYVLRFGNYNNENVTILINGKAMTINPAITANGSVLNITITVNGK